MSVVEVKPTDDVVAIAEGGIPVTGKMIQEWCAAYDAGELPAGYEFDGALRPGRPRLASNEATASMSFKCPESGAEMIARAARAAGVKKSAFMRQASLEKAAEVLAAVG